MLDINKILFQKVTYNLYLGRVKADGEFIVQDSRKTVLFHDIQCVVIYGRLIYCFAKGTRISFQDEAQFATFVQLPAKLVHCCS